MDVDSWAASSVFRILRFSHNEDLQILVFSTTFRGHTHLIAENMFPSALSVFLPVKDMIMKTITQTYIKIKTDWKMRSDKLLEIYGAVSVGQSIIFANSDATAVKVVDVMRAQGHTASLMSNEINDEPIQVRNQHRDKVMREFKNGVTNVLITTDALRGMDGPAVNLVVNFDLPVIEGELLAETYLHRIGSASRFGKRGVAVTLVCDGEMHLIQNIKTKYGCRISELQGDVEDMHDTLQMLR